MVLKKLALIGLLLIPATSRADSDAPCRNAASSRNLDLASTGVVVKSTGGVFCGYFVGNQRTSAVYLKLYNKAIAATNADTPVLTLPFPASSSANYSIPEGIGGFPAGISARCTTAIADSSTAAPATNECVANIHYK